MDTIRQHRTGDDPFEVVVSGMVSESVGDVEAVKGYAAAGATWWVEDISPLRLGLGWEDFWKEWDMATLRGRIEMGPPSLV